MNELKLKNDFTNLTTKEVDGILRFVGAEVCKMLNYGGGDVANVLNTHCKNIIKSSYQTTRGLKEVKWISEYDFYRLLLKSRRPEGKILSDWLCEEVLPSIRETGTYTSDVKLESKLVNLKVLTLKLEKLLK